MRARGRLGQSGGAGSKQVNGVVPHFRGSVHHRTIAVEGADLLGHVGVTGRGIAKGVQGIGVCQKLEGLRVVGLEFCLDTVKGLHQLFAHNCHFRLNQVNAVFQHLAFLRGIEHGAGDTEFGGAGHDGQQLRPVFKEYRNGIAFGESLFLQIACDSIGPRIQLAPGDRSIFEQDGRSIAEGSGVVFDQRAQSELSLLVLEGIVIKPPCDRRQAPKHAGQAAGNVQCGYVVLAHGFSVGPFYCAN